jgi:hypothetical protein
MRFRWPEETVFERVVLDVEQEGCAQCGSVLHICDHRIRHIYTLEQPLELCCRLVHCSDPGCPQRARTLSPAAELSIALPGWLVGWDVFCLLGHRRFARHWSVPQLRKELLDAYSIRLSDDAISVYLRRYQDMLAARQQDIDRLRAAYRDIDAVDLTIDGLQPEKGHETLYAVRELRKKRIWFAEALLSSNQAEINRLLGRAAQIADWLGKPVRLWMSDKQETFVTGIATAFPGTPHLYCSNHFLRDLAKPTLQRDSTAKVQMRQKVRGLRAIERSVLAGRRQAEALSAQEVTGSEEAAPQAARAAVPAPAAPMAEASKEAKDEAGEVVLDYCSAVRGILNDDQGGPLEPPGLRMAEALTEVRQSLGRCLEMNKPGAAHTQLARLAGCIDRGLAEVKAEQEEVKKQTEEVKRVAQTLDVSTGTLEERKKKYQELQQEFEAKGGAFYAQMAKVMLSWCVGLFAPVPLKEGEQAPVDNLELERFFRNPKGHERRIHGHKHAGVRIVQEGPTLLFALEAHLEHDSPFSASDLLPYRHARPPQDQQDALRRRKTMRKARSKKTWRFTGHGTVSRIDESAWGSLNQVGGLALRVTEPWYCSNWRREACGSGEESWGQAWPGGLPGPKGHASVGAADGCAALAQGFSGSNAGAWPVLWKWAQTAAYK